MIQKTGLILLPFAVTFSLHGALTITNPSFESFSDDQVTSSGDNNHELITNWFEELHGTDNGGDGDETAEQVLIEGGNRPLTTTGSYWGHIVDKDDGSEVLPAIYQSLGTWNTGDATSYTLGATLGDRNNQPFGALTFKFLTGDATATSPADGTAYADAFANITTLAEDVTGTLNGGTNTLTQAYSNTFDLVGLSDGDEIYLRIVMLGSNPSSAGGTERHSLIDDLSITAVPEPSTYAIYAGFLALGMVMVRRRLR